MSAIHPSTPISPVPPSVPVANKAEVKNGFIEIAGKTYRVQVGGVGVANEEFLQRVAKLFTQKTCDDLATKTASASAANSGEKSRLVITDKGIELTKGSAQAESLAVDHNITSFTDFTKVANKYHEYRKALVTLCRDMGYSKERVLDALKRIISEAPMNKMGESPWQDKTLLDVLHEPGNEALRSALFDLEHYKPIRQHEYENDDKGKLESSLRDFITKNCVRNPKMVEAEGSSADSPQKFVQQFATSKGGLPKDVEKDFAYDKAVPSRAQKIKQGNPLAEKDLKKKNVNLGAVIAPIGANPSCIVTRSGKSDTLHRLQEAVAHAAVEQIKTGKAGLVQGSNNPDKYQFTHHITSHLDSTGSLCAKEPKDLMNILKACDEWEDKDINVTVPGDTLGSTKTVTITLLRPIISSQMLSRHVSDPATSDKINFFSNIDLYRKSLGTPPQWTSDVEAAIIKLAEKAGGSPSGADNAYEFLMKKRGELMGKWVDSFFGSKEFKVVQGYIAADLEDKFKENQQDNELRALYAIMFRREIDQPGTVLAQVDPSKPEPLPERALRNEPSKEAIEKGEYPPKLEPEEELHALDLEIYRNIVLKKRNISSGKQCGYGTDRTSISVAVAVAQEAFRNKFGKEFIPCDHTGPANELLYFKKVFRDTLNEMGMGIAAESSGYSGIKLRYNRNMFQERLFGLGDTVNPSVYKYLFNGEDVAVIKASNPQADQIKSDVDGVTYEDINRRGTDQYKGQFADEDLVSQTVRKNHFSKSHEYTVGPDDQKAVTTVLVKLGAPEIESIFHSSGRQMMTPVALLGLDRTAVKEDYDSVGIVPPQDGSTRTVLNLFEEKAKGFASEGQKQLYKLVTKAYTDYKKADQAGKLLAGRK